jgi:hypothetical protein
MFGRIDGAESLFEWLFHPHVPPKPGSTLEQLVNLGTADFVWRGAAGGTILAHYVSSGLYCTGDNIDYDESLQVPGGHTGTLDVAPAATDAKIDGYVTALAPFAKTPYVFVPVGCDFQHPKDGLVSYMDGYNARRYPTTGAWAVAATFDDYEDLVGEWRDVLPELQVDLTPYYMGFYGSRADVKQGTRSAARPFFEAETFATALGDAGAALMNSAAPDFELLTRTDHHDFVTGTSADDVVANEQLPLLAQEQTAGATALAQVASAIAQRIPAAPGDVSRLLVMNPAGVARSDIAEVTLPLSGAMASSITASAGGVPIPFEIVGTPTADATSFDVRFAFDSLASLSWLAVDVLPGAPPSPPAPAVALQLLDADGAPATGDAVTRVILSNANVRAQWDDGAAGFGLTSLVIGGNEAIAAPSFFPRDYADMGGLWRTGNEMSGCSLTPVAAAVGTDTVEIVESTPLIAHVAFHSTADPAIREAWLGAGAAGLDLAITTGAQQATTRTVTINFAADANAELVTSLAAGYQKRPLQHVYTPTFWPAVEWAAVGELEPAQGASWAILLRQSTGVLMSAPGAVELMAARDARAEQCDVEGGMGSDTSTHHIEWRIERVSSPADAAREAQAYNRPIAIDIVGALPGGTLDLPVSMSLAQVDGDGILSALKPAERGGGVIVRALLLPGPVDVHLAPLFAGRAVTRTDALERDQSLLGTAGATLMFGAATSGSLATVRLE